MENNDSNLKPQPTGGLKLMTVFIAVLALHVVVIGTITIYHLMSGGSTDADLLTDKTHKNAKATPDAVTINDALPEASSADKNPTAPAVAPEVAGTPANPPAPSPDQTTPAATGASAPAPATPVAETPAPSAPAQSEMATTPVDIAPVPAPSASAPSAPVASAGPVTMPVTEPAPVSEPVTAAPYVVKAHDSLSRIARLNHTSVARLKATNGLTTDRLRIGQKLVLPGGTQVATNAGSTTIPEAPLNTAVLSASPTGPIMGTATLTKTRTSTGLTARSSPILAPAGLQHHLYVVVKGDTLIRIAHKFKTTPTAIMAANNITDAARLSIGKKLRIPSREARSAKISEPGSAPPSQVKENAPSAQLANFVPQG